MSMLWWLWKENEILIAVYVICEFGHNDQKEKSAGSGAWYNFSYNLKKFIDEVRKKGGNIQWNGINVSAGKLSENWNLTIALYRYHA